MPCHFTNYNTDLVIEGYPRSGNSYLFVAIKKTNPELKISSHTHSIANVKRAITYKKKVVILIRSPLEAVSSILIFHKNLSIALALKDYYVFYDFVLRNKNKFLIIDSNRMFKDKEYLVKKIKEIMKIKTKNISINDKEIFKSLKKENDRVSDSKLTLGYPSRDKNYLYQKVNKNILSDPKNLSKLNELKLIYEELRNN